MKGKILVILAAGMGSRYGGLKQLDKMSEEGDTIINFSVHDAIEAGFKKVVFVVRESFKEDFKKMYEKKLKNKIEIEYVCQELDKIPPGYKTNPKRVKPWGTGHAVLILKKIIHENFVVINGDDFYGKNAFLTVIKELDNLNKDSYDICMVGYNLKNTISENGSVSRGECIINKHKELTNIIERTHIEKRNGKIEYKDEKGNFITMYENTVVSMNFWGFTPKFFEVLEDNFKLFLKDKSTDLKSEFFIPEIVNKVVESRKGNVKVLKSNSKWMGVTYIKDKPLIVKEIKKLKEKGVYPKNILS